MKLQKVEVTLQGGGGRGTLPLSVPKTIRKKSTEGGVHTSLSQAFMSLLGKLLMETPCLFRRSRRLHSPGHRGDLSLWMWLHHLTKLPRVRKVLARIPSQQLFQS